MKKLWKPLVVLTMVAAMVLPAAAMAEAAPSRRPHGQTQQQQSARWLADTMANSEIQLSPSGRRFVNYLLKVATPVFCPIVGQIAAPALADFVVQGCLGIGTAPDPLAALGQFTPLLCADPGAIFPDYENVFVAVCDLL